MTTGKDEKVDVSRRSFFTRAAKAAGGLAATCVAATGLTKAVSAATAPIAQTAKAKAGCAHDNQQQLEKMSKQQMVLMSDSEKDQMLDEILRHHYKETA